MLININKANIQDLKTLGFNDEWAKWIIDYREWLKQDPAHQTGFANENDLRQMNLPAEYLGMIIGKVAFEDGTQHSTSSSNLNNLLGSMGNTDTGGIPNISPNNLQPQGDGTLLASNDPNFNPGRESFNTENASDRLGAGSMNPMYWEGLTQATIEQSQIQCSWPARDAYARIKFINDVFLFWFEARGWGSKIGERSPEQDHIDEILDKAGTAGYNDLKDLFNHLQDHSGYWSKYCETATYFGGGQYSLFYWGQLEVPKVLVNFTNVIEENLEGLKGYCNQFYTDTGELESALKTGDWTRIGEVLKNIHTWSSRAKNVLWMYPKPYQLAKKVASYSDALSNIHDSLTTYANTGSAAIASLEFAVTFVPVLGSYYKAMVAMIPNAQNWFSDVIDTYCRRIDAAAAGRP